MKTYPKYQGPERSFQKSVAQYLDSIGVLWFHPPNEAKRTPRQGAALKAQGLKAGVPDVMIIERRGSFPPYNGLAIELKVGYNKPSEHQKEWLKRLEDAGWKTLVSYSLDEVIDVVDTYLGINKQTPIK